MVFTMPKGILDRLHDGPVLGDGGYLLELEKRGYVQAGPFTPEVVIDHPDALEQLHREFLRAGADVLQTMTFYASDDKLATVGLDGKVDDINRSAVQIARKVAAEEDALVARGEVLDGGGEDDPRVDGEGAAVLAGDAFAQGRPLLGPHGQVERGRDEAAVPAITNIKRNDAVEAGSANK